MERAVPFLRGVEHAGGDGGADCPKGTFRNGNRLYTLCAAKGIGGRRRG